MSKSSNFCSGSNQRLEFLGDTVLQLIASEYLYRFFPDHHEGHLSVSFPFQLYYTSSVESCLSRYSMPSGIRIANIYI